MAGVWRQHQLSRGDRVYAHKRRVKLQLCPVGAVVCSHFLQERGGSGVLEDATGAHGNPKRRASDHLPHSLPCTLYNGFSGRDDIHTSCRQITIIAKNSINQA
eukprot:365338-Chlamydomonas_euryale.AAC.5